MIVGIQTIFIMFISWVELKLILTRNFADQRDQTCLNRDIVLMNQLPNEKSKYLHDK